jgi:hypothetical protein
MHGVSPSKQVATVKALGSDRLHRASRPIHRFASGSCVAARIEAHSDRFAA